MANTRVWILEYVAGNPKMFKAITRDKDCPLTRTEALQRANKIAANGWRVWVFHSHKGDILFESQAEKEWKEEYLAKGDYT